MTINFVLGLIAGYLLVRLFAILPRYIASSPSTVTLSMYFLFVLVVAYQVLTAETLPVSSAQSTAYEEFAE